MKRFGWQWIVVNSILLTSLTAAETRPQYGGTLRIAIEEAPSSLDPTDNTQADSIARRNLLALLFETLIAVDDRGGLHPELATTWEADPGNQRWRFHLRPGVHFKDGSLLTSDVAAASLRAANPSWKVFAEDKVLVIELDHGNPHLPAELGLMRNFIVERSGAKLGGTGPFHIEEWQPGKRLTLSADENHWRGRSFVTTIEVEMGRNFQQQLVELELGKADMVEIAPEQQHRAAMEGRRTEGSQPMELLALVFASDVHTSDEKFLRSTLALCLDREAMKNVLLQGAGQPAASLLPNWLTGYAFTFSTDADLKRARRERGQVRAANSWTLGYDANDSLARLLSERIALNAKDAGLDLQPTAAGSTDLRLMRIPLATADPWTALANAADSLGIAMPKAQGDSIEDLYAVELSLLSTQRVIPLFHLPATYAASPRVENWVVAADGSWRLEDVWVGSAKP